MKYLITGGAGFIGIKLANRLVAEGHSVRVLDDLSSGSTPDELHPDVDFARGDVRDVPRLWTLLREIDCVYHLAARVSVPESVLYPVEYNGVNVGGTVALMTAVRDAGVKRVVLTSSGAIYGEQHQQPIQESAIAHPATPYAVSKLAAEYYVQAMARLYDIHAVVLRIFNAYGPGQPCPPSHPPVIPQFVRQAMRGGSVVIFGNGQQTRDFIYVEDVIDALVAAGKITSKDEMILNIGSGQETTIDGLIALIGKILGKSVHPIYSRAQSGGISRAVSDINLARQYLNFTPQVGLETGLRHMLEYYTTAGLGRGR
ncbi:MAG: NAD-dependent epimerase/dehydratase family protein [Chloroflexi bacterium]|nr:NAD-dependent epimerase/dehydratase family protein [Chloroflexota bacterium]